MGLIGNLTAFDVTGVAVTQVAAALNLDVPHTSIAIHDTTGDVQTDLTGGSSVLIPNSSKISGIIVTGPVIMYLSETQAIAASAVLQLLDSVVALHVTGVAIDQVDAVIALAVDETILAITASADLVTTDLTGGSSVLLANSGAIGTISLTGGTTSITMTEAQATTAGVGTVLGLISNLSALDVTGVHVNQISTVLSLGISGTSLAISDTAGDVQGDLTGGSSALEANHAIISGITLTDPATPLTLTVNQISTGAAVLGLIASYALAVSDSAGDVGTDLGLAHPR